MLGVLDAGLAAVMEDDKLGFVGVFLGIAHENLMSGRKMLSEVFLWVDPIARGHGKKLLTYVEDWAMDNGCKELVLSAPVSETRAAKTFEAWKFTPSEVWYRKRVD